MYGASFFGAGTVELHSGEIIVMLIQLPVAACLHLLRCSGFRHVFFSQNVNAIVYAIQTNCFTGVFSLF